MKILKLLCLLLISFQVYADSAEVNVYIWGGMPNSVIHQFEVETGIRVNIATYDMNETMYAKLKANPKVGYDVIQPSTYYVEKMRKENMLAPLDLSQIPNVKDVEPEFRNPSFDPHNGYSIPYSWGVTAMFINRDRYPKMQLRHWADLWKPEFKDKLLLINDVREVFAMALFKLGEDPNETNPVILERAFQQLLLLRDNIKLYSGDSMITILSDADADVGMSWNANVFKAKRDNPGLEVIYPDDPVLMWSDTLAIPKYSPNKKNAHRFINFLLKAQSAKEYAVANGLAMTLKTVPPLLPASTTSDPAYNPPKSVLQHSVYLRDVDNKVLDLYQQYWQRIKL